MAMDISAYSFSFPYELYMPLLYSSFHMKLLNHLFQKNGFKKCILPKILPMMSRIICFLPTENLLQNDHLYIFISLFFLLGSLYGILQLFSSTLVVSLNS